MGKSFRLEKETKGSKRFLGWALIVLGIPSLFIGTLTVNMERFLPGALLFLLGILLLIKNKKTTPPSKDK